MTWTLVFLLAAGAYALKLFGVLALGNRTLNPTFARCVMLIPAALLGALIAKDTFTDAHHIVLDARAVGLAVAVVATWRKLPFALIIVLGVGSTALVRALS